MAWMCGTRGRVEKFIHSFGRKIKVMATLGRNKRKWREQIKMYLKEKAQDVEWITDTDWRRALVCSRPSMVPIPSYIPNP
jgi:hypothetical protein